MSTLRQAAQAALDVMNFDSPAGEGQTAAMDRFIDEHDAAVAGLTAALAAPEQEPVAWLVYVAEHSNQYCVDNIDDAQLVDDCTNHNAEVTPLYTAPPNIEALTKERDAALEQNTLLDAACAKLEAEREALMQAAKLALDALDEAATYTSSPSWSPSMTDECRRAIEALKKAGVK